MTVSSEEGLLLVDDRLSLKLGQLIRYKITVDKSLLEPHLTSISELYLAFKNTESALLKPVYLTGPYSFYVDIQPCNYNEWEGYDEEVAFCDDVKPNDEYRAVLKLNNNSRFENSEKFVWQINVVSQLSVTNLPSLRFRLCLTTKPTPEMPKGPVEFPKGVVCEKWDTHRLWNLPPRSPDKPVHLVILTHGIFSNAGCDMVYLKDRIEATASTVGNGSETSNLIVRGFKGNQGRSSKGVKSNGIALAKYIIETIDNLKIRYDLRYISFVGHSLGGLTQSMAIRYICIERPDIFDSSNGLEPLNFITLASPYLGVAGEVPPFVTAILDIGALGQTGVDLNLNRTFFLRKEGIVRKDQHLGSYKRKPLLEIIPSEPLKSLMHRFKNRTTYANILHDGIVPLRTAALLYLDWKALSDVRGIRKENGKGDKGTPDSTSKNDVTGKIPEESMDKKSALKYLLPQGAIRRKYKRYSRTQIRNQNEDESKQQGGESGGFTPPPNANPIISAANVIVAPLPSQEYFKDPKSREDRIVHDKVYFPDELPPAHYKKRELIKKVIYPNDRIYRVQERIARQWQETLTWRKVLVSIQPDSHNNIVVRRKFVNAFGWVVIDHLVKEHFGAEGKTQSVSDSRS
ncbi:putative hydrolase [Lachancea thermotolerans CBS 6340]|uniref:KLTH0G04510p n=1 Tax=Lachancea thermotolerans (strain ATCC 56472 / CBS 6340 / NRRL Y-8284) TaxID=559295 RepID=C5DLY5_LACTC|nr:KLTH0G04510p [Lachancea thermotolerans CBS 6340]CAR24796.1 KLTH0G04510p [Lachancea thermotolerans CBS 6340]